MLLRRALKVSLLALLSFGCGTSSKDQANGGGHVASGGSAEAGSTSTGGHAGTKTSGGGGGGRAGGSGQANGGGSGSSDGSSGRGGGKGSGGNDGEGGDTGGSDTSGSGGTSGANAGGSGGSSASGGNGAVAGAAGSSGGPCGASPCTDTTVMKLAGGGATVCALFYSGQVKCWGNNYYGTLGYGDKENVGDDELPSAVGHVSLTTSPGVVAKQISVGLTHACTLLTDGSVRCWGRQIFGCLGSGNDDDLGDDELPSDVAPVSVTTEPGVSVTQISAGASHTCALLSDGTIKCWGDNSYRQLGYSDTQDVGDDEVPSELPSVSVSATPGVTVSQVSAGDKHTCALLSDGSVKCWGANFSGQRARGAPDNMADPLLPVECEPITVTTEPDVTVVAIRASFDSTCVLLSNGSAKCWGDAPEERVGTGETGAVIDPSTVGPIQVTTDTSLVVTALATGVSHVCARLSDGSASCWGASQYGALGYGNIESIGDDEQPSSAGPVSVTTTPGLTVTELVAGSEFTCALLSDQSVQCWGDNRFGQLGNGKVDGYAVGDDELPSTVGPVTLL